MRVEVTSSQCLRVADWEKESANFMSFKINKYPKHLVPGNIRISPPPPTLGRSLAILRGKGGSNTKIFKETDEAKLKFPKRVGGVQIKENLCGDMEISWNNTITF